MTLMTGVLLNASRFTGGPQSASRLARCETQISIKPVGFLPLTPPGRSEVRYRLSPFFEIAAQPSLYRVLTTGPRLTGVDHGPNGPSRSLSSSSGSAKTAAGRRIAARPSAPAPCRSLRRGTPARRLVPPISSDWRRECMRSSHSCVKLRCGCTIADDIV